MMSMILGAVAGEVAHPARRSCPGPITADDRDHPDVERNPARPAVRRPCPARAACAAGAALPSPHRPSASNQSSPVPPSSRPWPGLSASARARPPRHRPGTTSTTTPAALLPTPAAPAPAPGWEEAHASKAPASRARVRGPELGVPGVLTFTGGESSASADGGVSSSIVHLGRLVLGGAGGAPEVVLSNLVWTARQEMGKPGTASFAIGSVTVAGQALPIPAGASPRPTC